jgi:hypothetical protein
MLQLPMFSLAVWNLGADPRPARIKYGGSTGAEELTRETFQ